MWYFDPPGVTPGKFTPLGVYDDPPPEDVPMIRGVRIGRSGVARLSRNLTALVDDVTDLLDSIVPGP